MAARGFQFFVRFIQFFCSAVVLALFTYFLIVLINHDMPIALWVPAVTGISGAGVVYVILALLFLCCLPGHPFPSILFMILDVVFMAGFAYVAVVNRGGASSCEGEIETAFGRGDAETNMVDSEDGDFLATPSLQLACKMETASLVVSIIADVFFIISIILGVVLIRNRRKEKRLGPSPANDYTSGYGTGRNHSSLSGRKSSSTGAASSSNTLPSHTSPDDVRDSFATEQTHVSNNGYSAASRGPSKQDPPFEGNAANNIPAARYPNASNGYRYDNNGGVYQ
ncbi:MARVEL domain-containing protein [Madurella fahalii]|uniref:MARVEL domain-containing protein n=1 Tax=Madurella fahalii TaxID=1157608 RepID=A0ABQ0G8U3_9PEZI